MPSAVSRRLWGTKNRAGVGEYAANNSEATLIHTDEPSFTDAWGAATLISNVTSPSGVFDESTKQRRERIFFLGLPLDLAAENRDSREQMALTTKLTISYQRI